jgi:hypothetical protein
MMVGATVEKVNFGMMMEQLQKITGLSFKQIVRAQAKLILNHAVKHTPKASVAKIVERYYPHGLTLRKATGGNEISTLKESGVTYPLSDQDGHRWYYPNKIWRKIMRQTKESVSTRVEKRGLQASQFYLMGRAVGIDVKAQKFIIKASKHIAGTSRGTQKGILDYELILKSVGVKANGSGNAKFALAGAIQSRKEHYKIAIEKGVMKKLGSVKSQFGLR